MTRTAVVSWEEIAHHALVKIQNNDRHLIVADRIAVRYEATEDGILVTISDVTEPHRPVAG